MDLNLSGRGLFVFSDPGGAKPILSYVKLFHEHEYLIITDRDFDFFTDYGLNIMRFEKGLAESVFSIIDKFNPKFVLTGTSYTSNIELRFIDEANRLGIQTVTYIDHYTRYLDRFLFNDFYIFPKRIFITDQRAFGIAHDYELDKHASIEITGNFHHKFLKTWKPNVTKAEFFCEYGLIGNEKIIIFAPDPLSNVGGKGKYGFDETDVWNTIEKAISNFPTNDLKIFLKMHPNQSLDYFKQSIYKTEKVNVYYATNLHTNTLIYY